jgi:hypothetical protein
MPLSDSFDNYLLAQEDAEKSHKADFRYSIDDYALSREHIEGRLSEFYATYRWPRAVDQVQAIESVEQRGELNADATASTHTHADKQAGS